MSAVRVEDLEKRYGAVAALERVSFSLPAGTLALVSGPNGAGKSTLLRVLGMLTRPTRGHVELLDVDAFGGVAAGMRSRVAYLGAGSGLYGELTLEENLRFCARLLGLSGERAALVIDELGLRPLAHRRVRTLSLGFQRRAGLARVLLGSPDLLLLDEPWNGLDAAAADQLTALLARRREAGRTTLVAAHEVARAHEIFDARLSMQAGRLASLERASPSGAP